MKTPRLFKPIRIAAAATATVAALGLSHSRMAAQQPPSHKNQMGQMKKTAPSIDSFFDLFRSPRPADALRDIANAPHPGNTVMLMEVLPYLSKYGIQDRAVKMIETDTGVRQQRSSNEWYRAIWQKDYEPHPGYAEFKSRLYSRIDPRFAEYFDNDRASTIRLDEVRWGGVIRDGIPPLKDPITLAAKDATYLGDNDVVFGVVVNGESRAYPKRILAWHEMVKDTVGGKSINGVYCTLCGSMIVYFPTDANGVHHELGTSGFLYRSNKLMYDHATKSMWSTIKGEPVIGPLVGQGIKLPVHNVVTTNWKHWKTMHPDTRVLSLKTGHRRDYGEGVAYRDYFATDRLMFTTPQQDRRLKNKDEVFIVRHREEEEPLAMSAEFLNQHPVYHDRIGKLEFVVATDSSGANRAFESKMHQFRAGMHPDQLLDEAGEVWSITEDSLVAADGISKLARLPSHRAFWFGWYAVHPRTRLVN